jgi:hypothetical protein
MDDFNVTSLHESKNEWGARLLTILTPLIIEGFQSIYEESFTLCKENNEIDKHLMTFQNFLSRIPKWNTNILEVEQKRITDKSACAYLEDLITCVHIIQLKLLTAVRVGSKNKKIDVKIPKLEDFIHKVYILAARKIYKNVYLYERNIPPLQIQKNNRELEVLIQESILNAVRESIPIDNLLRSYLDESIEEDVQVEIHEEVLDAPIDDEVEQIGGAPVKPQMFQKNVSVSEDIVVPSVTELASVEQLSEPEPEPEPEPELPRRLESQAPVIPPAAPNVTTPSAESSGDKLVIGESNVSLDHTDVHSLDPPKLEVIPDLLIDDIEVL